MFDYARGVEQKLERIFRELERDAAAALRAEGFATSQQRHERSLGLRYKGQSFELTIKQSGKGIAADFHRAHRERYGYSQESNIVEIVNARLRSTGLVEKVAERKTRADKRGRGEKASRVVKAFIDGKELRVQVYQRSELPAGARLRAPCIVTEYSATTLIPPGARAKVDEYGNLILVLEKTR